MTDPLKELRPLHLPDPISWWPPAPGWWLLGLLLILAVMVGVYGWRRNRLRRIALKELGYLVRQGGTPQQRISALGILLRRYAIIAYPGSQVEGLCGEAWLQFLDNHGGGGEFMSGAGRSLIDAPFQRQTADDDQALIVLVRRWIRANREAR